jgi:hypothetical protein
MKRLHLFTIFLEIHYCTGVLRVPIAKEGIGISI